MSADTDTNNIIPYETLKAQLDQATVEMEAASVAFYAAVHREDPPLLIKIALNNFDAAYAAVTARTSAIVREYGHLAGVTQKIEEQRDEINRKYESMKKTVNQIRKLNLDDGDDAPANKNDQNQNNKGKRRKK